MTVVADSRCPHTGRVTRALPTVVIADDHAMFVDAVVGLLESAFDVVATAEDGSGLIAAAERHDPDVLVVDIAMPGLSGLEAVRSLRRTKPDVVIVMLTAYEDPELVEASLEAGANGFVVKSHMGSDLVRAIHDARTGKRFVSTF